MKSQEKPEIPAEICPICYNPKSAHAADCDYEEKVRKHDAAEGITPEFKSGVKSGEITFEKQMEEISSFWKSLNEPLPPLSQEQSIEVRTRFEKIMINFEDGRDKVRSHNPEIIKKALAVDNKLGALFENVNDLYGKIIGKIQDLAHHYASGDAESVELIKELEEMIGEFGSLSAKFDEEVKSFE